MEPFLADAEGIVDATARSIGGTWIRHFSEALLLYLGGLWSSKGAENGIDKAAKDAGVTKISHVDTYQKNYFFGIVTEQITKVYGE